GVLDRHPGDRRPRLRVIHRVVRAGVVAIPPRLDRALGKIGEWSYSIYLLHFFFRAAIIWLVGARAGSAGNFLWAWPFATPCFVAFLPVAAVSYRWLQSPFLTLRKRYTGGKAPPPRPFASIARLFAQEPPADPQLWHKWDAFPIGQCWRRQRPDG